MTKREERRQLLAAFARRAIVAMRAQRDRLQQEPIPADYDLDFYAHAAWQLRESCRQAIKRLDLKELRQPLAEFDKNIPGLQKYRDAMTHALDDKIRGWIWFNDFVGIMQLGGAIEHLVGPNRGRHELFERFYSK